MSPLTFNRLRNQSQADYDAFVDWLGKTTPSELRTAQGHMEATREALLRFFRRGLRADLLLDDLMQILFFQPSQTGSIFSRVGYTAPETEFNIRMVKAFTIAEIGITFDDPAA